MHRLIITAISVAIFTLATPTFASTTPIMLSVETVNLEKEKYQGKSITVRGKVIKVNNRIMRRNFIHISDGTGSGDSSKIVITSQQTAVVGDEITATGIVALNIDFTMGYKYDILIEQATITPVK